jgi:predicted TPR repeat methyltransferase
MLAPLRRLLAPRDTRRTVAEWDDAFAGGRWDYLTGLPEMARTAVIAGYIQAAATREPRVLDIGCGEGVLLEAIRDRPYRSYVGLDLSAVAIARAKERANARDRFLVADARGHVPDEAPDVIVFNEVLYYFDDIAAVVGRYLATLAPGGVAIASVYKKAKTERVWRALARVADIRDRVTIRHDNGTAWRVALISPRRRAS